jgi:ABC-type antimicrobial peptide transport system permease subunit
MISLSIASMWIVTILLMFASLYGMFMIGNIIGNVSFWLFAQAFGMVDNYLQDQYWKNKGYQKMVDDKGNDWYVGYDK